MNEDIYVKAGDKVKCIKQNYEPIVFGEVYTVKKAKGDFFILEGFGRDSWTNPLNRLNIFELYKGSKTFNKGDKVKFIGKIGDYSSIGWTEPMEKYINIGQTGTVLRNDLAEINSSVEVIFNSNESWHLHIDSLELVEDNQSIEQAWEKLIEDIIQSTSIPSALLYPSFQVQSRGSIVIRCDKVLINKKRKFKRL